MPKSNVKYPFEVKVLEGLEKLGSDLFGTSSDISAFIIQLNDNAQILNTLDTVHHPDFNFWGDWDEDVAFKSFLFLDVIEHGEYIFIKWQGITQEDIEKLLELNFIDKDFVSVANDNSIAFPMTHNVMF